MQRFGWKIYYSTNNANMSLETLLDTKLQDHTKINLDQV